MIRKREVTATILFIFLALPVAFQSLHQFHHAVHEKWHPAEPVTHFSHSHEQCPLCTYEFAKFDHDRKPFSLSGPDFTLMRIHIYLPQPPYAYSGSDNRLRAPPQTVSC